MTITLGTDTFETVAGADAYFATHPYPGTWSAKTDAEKESYLRHATIILDRLRWTGTVANDTQALSWPRENVYNKEGVLLASDTVPAGIKRATSELALAMISENLDADSTSDGIKRVRARTVEVEYVDGGAPTPRMPRSVRAEIAQFLKSGGSGFQVPTLGG